MRIRIKEKVYFAGRIYEPGEEVILPDGVRGPHRAVARGEDRVDYGTNPPIDANRRLGDIVDVPLYDVISGPAAKPDRPMADNVLVQAQPAALGTLEGLIGLLADPEATKNALANLKQKQDELTALQEKITAAAKAHDAREAELNQRAKELDDKTATLDESQKSAAASHVELSERAAAIDTQRRQAEAAASARDQEFTKRKQEFETSAAESARALTLRETKVTISERAIAAKHDELDRREAAVALREQAVKKRVEELSSVLRPL